MIFFFVVLSYKRIPRILGCEEHVYQYRVGYGRNMSTGCIFQQVYRKLKTISLVVGN